MGSIHTDLTLRHLPRHGGNLLPQECDAYNLPIRCCTGSSLSAQERYAHLYKNIAMPRSCR